MAIRFECEYCGAKLKAPDGTTGRMTKCLKCARPVTVPEPVYEAELVDDPGAPTLLSAADTFDPPPDPNDPYGLADAPAATAVAEESRRPCPMCGELILSSAIKCRFCGEVFDKELGKKPKKKAIKANRDTLYKFRRNLHGLAGFWVFWGLVQMGEGVVYLSGGGVEKGVDPAALQALGFIIAVMGVVFLISAIFSFMKHLWAIWVGTVDTVLRLLILLLALAGGEPSVIGGIVINAILLIQAIRVIQMGGVLKKAGVPLSTPA